MLISYRFVSAPLFCFWLAGCGGAESTRLDTRAGPGSAEPHLAVGAEGTIILSYLESLSGAVTLRYSVLSDEGWGEAQTLASGADWFVNWADFPSVVPLTESRWAAHWLVKTEGNAYAYNAMVAVSEDAGGIVE